MSHAWLKIYGTLRNLGHGSHGGFLRRALRQRPAAQDAVHVRLELDLQPIKAAKPDVSIPLYEQFCKDLSGALGKEIGTGIFGADMKVELLNDGPVTICMDTKNKE